MNIGHYISLKRLKIDSFKIGIDQLFSSDSSSKMCSGERIGEIPADVAAGVRNLSREDSPKLCLRRSTCSRRESLRPNFFPHRRDQ